MTSSWSLNNWQQQQQRQKQQQEKEKDSKQNNGETSSLDSSLDEWMRTQPLSVLQLDPADRIVLKIADERDAIQKKTFTKWVNKHLKKAGKNVEDLFLDLQDGHNLVSLLEVLSGESLKREKGRMRIHRLQNVQTCLDFLESKNVRLVNIQGADIVDGNPKLTLGLIWSIILHFQVSEITREEEGGLTAKDALMQWARRVTDGYPGVNVRDMTTSWRDGLAFNAILHKYRPDIINWREVRSRMNTRQRLDHAFGMAEHEFGVTRLLDPEDVEVAAPDERSMITYISTLYDALPDRPAAEKYDRDINDYRAAASDFLQWVHRTTRTMQDRSLPFHVTELKQLLNEIERFKATDLPPRLREKQHLEQIYMELENLFADTAFMRAIEDELSGASLERAWQQLLASISEREHLIMERHGLQGNAQDISRRLLQDIGATNEKLDTILTRIDETETRTRVTSPRQLKESYDGIIHDLNLLEAPIDGFFRDVESLKSARHAQANEFYKQVFGLHQRRVAYLERCGVVVGADGKFVSMRTDFYMSEEYFYSRETLFKTAEESIEWVDRKLKELSEMPFVEDLKILEENMEKHKVEHRDIMDFRVKVDQCIAHQAKISAEDSGAYCDLLHTLEEGYAQLRELSTGRVLDLDSLIAFIRSAQIELLWINEREELEVSRNWSDVGQLDLPMLQNYYKQLMHEIELREEQFNAVHNQGAALINQGHPAVYVIEAYLTTMQAQWDWLLSLTQCLEIHLQDALNTQQFVEDAQNCEQWMEKQMQLISTHYDRGDFTLDEGERMLRELEEIREMLDRYHDILLSLIERSRIISPLWQRGERITRPLPVIALCNYQERNIQIRKNDECMLVDNSDMIKWMVRTPEGVEGVVPSVVFRMPPPDERLLSFLQRLQTQFDRLRRSWTERQRMVRFTMILNTMRTIRGWDLKQFMALDPEQREAIINALNDDTNKLLAELDPNDPLAQRLREELRLTNEHFYKLLQAAQRGPEPELSDKFDEKIALLLQRFEESWKTLNDRVGMPLPRDIDVWEKQIHEHKAFEDSLQALDSDVSMLQELFRQLDNPTVMQRSKMDQMLGRWEDLWDLSRMFAERLKALEMVLNGLTEAVQIVSEHEITLASFISMPSRVDELRGVHSQLLEIQLILQQQQPIMDDLATNVGQLRQHVARTRFNVADHPDVDRLEDEVQRVTVRWENICMQVIERLKSAELSLQSLMIYRAAYESEVAWLDRVEATINQLRNPQDLRAEEYQEHLDILLAEYAHLNERTQAMENVNLEGGKYIRDARVYDIRLSQYKDSLDDVHKGIESLIRRHASVPTPGADVVAKELDELNKRFAQLSSIIYQRRNDLQLLMQKYQQKQLEDEERLRREEQRRRAEEERRLAEERQRLLLEKEQRDREEEERRRRKALEDLERERQREEREREMQRLRELEEEKERLRREEEERRRRERERAAEEERRRREEEERRKREREEAERRRREEEERRLHEREDLERRRREAEERRRLEEEKLRLDDIERKRREEEERKRLDEERRRMEEEARRRREREDEERRRREKEEEDRLRERERWEREQRERIERTRVDIPIVKETFVSHKHITPPPMESKTVTVVVPTEPKRPDTQHQWHIRHEQHFREGIPGDLATPFDEPRPLPVDVKMREHEDETDVIMYAEETEQRTKFYELEAIKHMQTGEILTFVEAVRQGLLDLHSGEFFDIISGSRISLVEAVERGYISQSFNDCLQTKYGIRDPSTGEELTLFEAIQRGLYDPECRQLRDPSTGDLLALYEASRLGVISMDNVHRLIKMGILKLPPLHLEQAIEQKVVDLESGQFIGRFSRETLPLREALLNGYVTISPNLPPMIAITLTECIEQRFIDPQTGEFLDKHTNEKFTLRDAVSKQNNLINLNVREVVNTSERKRVTVGDAILKTIINPRQGNFMDTAQRQTSTLLQAHEEGFIQMPITLKTVAERDLIDSIGHFIDAGTKKRMTLLEAVAEGLIDPDVPHIVDPNEKDTISLADALERGIITPRGFFSSPETNEEYTLGEAHRRGILVEPVKFTVFDVKGFRNTKTNQMLSFNEAVDAGAIQLQSERFIDLASNESYLLPDTVEKGRLLDPMLHMILSAVAGVKDKHGNELSVFKAIAEGVIDARKGAFVDKQSGKHLQPKEAYERGAITLKGAMQLTALFNVHPSLIAVTKVPKLRRKRIHARVGGEERPLQEGEVRMKLADAMRQGLIDAKAQRFRAGDREITLHDALNQGLIDTSAEWIVPAMGAGAGGPTVQESVTEQMTETSQVLAPKQQPSGQTEETVTTVKRIRTKETTAAGGAGGVAVYRAITSGRGSLEVPVEGLHIFTAERDGLFDMNTGMLTVPDSDRTLTLEEALDLGILNSKQFSIVDQKTREKLSIGEAMERGILERTGHMRDHKTGRTLSLQAAIDADHVIIGSEQPARPHGAATKVIQFGHGHKVGPVMSITPIGTSVMEESETAFSFDTKTGEIVDGFSGHRMSLDEAVRTGKVGRDVLRVKDALTDREMSYLDSTKWGVIEKETDRYSNKRDGTNLSLKEAAVHGLIFLTGGVPEYSRDAVRTDVRQQTRKIVTTKETAIAGPAAFVDYSLQKVIELGWYDPKSGSFTHPDTRRQMSLKDAIMKGLFNPYESVVINSKTGEQISFLDAVQAGVVDASNGTILDEGTNERMDLKTACERGLIRSGVLAQSLETAISSGRVDLGTGEVKSPDSGGPMQLHEAIARGIIEPSSMVVKDPSTGEEMPFQEAVRAKVVDLSHGLVINKRTGDGVSLTQAIMTGTIQPIARPGGSRTPLTIAPVSHSAPRPRGGVSPGSRERLIDLGGDKQAMVKVIKDEHGIEKGEYVDSATGMKFTVRLHGDPYATQMKTTVKSTAQVESIEMEPHVELVGINKVRDTRTGKEMSLADAQRLGLARVNKHGKQLTKTYAVFRSDLSNALKRGVIDPRPGKNENVSLADAIKSRLIDITNLFYINPESGEHIDFVQAANQGLLDVTLAEVLPKGVCNPANGERISIQRAIEMRIIDPKSGNVSNPFKNEQLTWLDILKPVYASMTMEGIYDPRKGYAVPIPSAINDGLINVKSREYHNPITDERYSLEEASKIGLIDEGTYKAITTSNIHDWRTGKQVSLLEAVQSGIVDAQHRTVQVGKGASLPVSKAIEEGKFPQDIGQRMRRVDKLTFAEALSRGFIDVRSNQYHDHDTGRRMTVAQALQEGYIDTGSVESQEGTDERNLSNVIDSYEFDENSGRIREQKTGLYLTFREAIDRNVIDGDSLICDVDTGRTMTLRSASNIGLITSDGKFVDKKTGAKLNLKDAVRGGFLALIPSPMEASQAFAEAIKRRETEGLKFRFERPDSPGGSSLGGGGGGRVSEEVHASYRMSTPSHEPTLSLRVRTEDVSDRLRSLINDPQAYADRQQDFLHRLRSKNIDVDEKVVENPASGTRVSIREAVDSGILDVVSGEVVHPSTGRRYSVPKAVHMKYIQPSAAKSVMEALNLNLEELYVSMQGMSPRSDFSPIGSFGSPVSMGGGTASGPSTNTFTKDIVWRGDASDLRGSGHDLSQYTTTHGTRAPIDESTGATSTVYEERVIRTVDDGLRHHTDDGQEPVVTRRVEETIRRTGGPMASGDIDQEAISTIEQIEPRSPTVVDEHQSPSSIHEDTPDADEIGERYGSCGNAIDGLLGTLRGNRQELSQRLLGGIREEDAVDGSSSSGGRNFKDGITFVRERDSFHRKLDAEVKEHLKTADQLSSAEGAAVLSPEEFHNLRKRSDALKNEYNDDTVRLEKVLNRLTAASKLKDQFDTQADAFRKWMERTNGSLDRMLASTTESSSIASCQKQCRELNDDVSGHRSELDAITTLARQIQDEVKGYATQLTEDESIAANVPALTAVKSESEGLVSSWQGLKDRCQLSHHQIEDAKNFFILYGQLKSWLSSKGKLVAVMGPVGVDTRLIDNQQQQIQVLLDECEGQKPTLDEFVRCGNSLLAAQTSQETKQPISEKIGEINDKWTDLINRLNEKKSGLSAEIDLAAKFRRQQSELKAGLDEANDRIEKFLAVAPTTANVEQRVTFIRELQTELDKKAIDLQECENTADRLAAVSENPGIRADVRSKLQAVQQPYQETKKKLGNLQTAVDRFMSEGNEIGRQVDGILSWLRECKTRKDKFGSISANEEKLRADVEKFDEFYREVLDHEVEVGLVKRRGAEAAQKNDDADLRRKIEDIDQIWEPLLEWTRNRRSRIDGAVNVENQYKRAVGIFVPHLTEAEDELKQMRTTPRAITIQSCEKDAAAAQEFRNKIASYTHEWTSVEHLGEELIKCMDADHLDIQDKLDKLRDRWHVLGKSARKTTKDREAQVRALNEFNQAAAETGGAIAQCQDHVLKAIDSHSSADFEKLKGVVDGLLASVEGKYTATKEAADNVKSRSGSVADDFSEVDGSLASLEAKINELRSNTDSKIAQMEAASSSVAQIRSRITSMDKDFQQLSTEFDRLGPLARDPDIVINQLKLTEDFLTALKEKSTNLDETKAAIEDLRNRGYPSDAAICDSSLERSRDTFNDLKSKGELRCHELRKLSGELIDLLRDTEKAREDISRAVGSDVLAKPLTNEGEDISSQFHVLQVFKDGLDPLFGAVNSVLGRGRYMIKSAGQGVDTNTLEKETEKLSSSLFDLKTKIAEREKQLDNAGTYQDSLNSLLSWLAEQESAIGISPSADPKVLKAQIEAQKFLQKLIHDKKPSIDSYKKSAETMAQRASPEERENLIKQSNEIGERYDRLVNDAKERREKLQIALELAEQWADDYPPLLSWLDNAERRLQKEYVSIDAERMASQIDDHKTLHEEIEGHRPLMDNVIELGTHLRDAVADDEADQLEQQLVELATRYDQLGARSVQVEEDLLRVAQGLDDFLSRTDELGIWLDDVGAQLERFETLSAFPDTLQEQTQELMTLGEEINDQQQKVSDVIDEGRELCKHARGDEAVALQGKLDGLRWKYSELSKTVDKKLGMVQEIMPLAETFEYSNKVLGTWLGDVESDLDKIDDASLDEKHALISNIEHDMKEFRPVLGDLTVSGARLSQLCPGDQTALTDGVVSRTQKRFENVEDQIRKKSEQLSRLMDARGEVVANMDDLIDWFQKAEAQILDAGAAPAESEAAKKQLQDQKMLHSDVGSQRARSRELLNSAKKVLKDVLGDDAQAIEDKIEVLKELSDNVHQLSSDRLNVLEQAVPLAEHFDSTRNDLGKWLDVIENELEAVPSVVAGMHPDQLRKHLDHNKALQDSIQENKPLVDSLNKSGAALSQLCNSDDSNLINDVLDQLNGRFELAREQARSRGNALNDALQQSLEVADQLDNMLDSLAITVDRVRHPEPVAVHPDRLRDQLQDNSAVLDELEQKHDAYKNVLAAAEDILRKADPSDPAVSEIKGKMDTLNGLWNEILSATEERGRRLDDTLVVAQKFWDELHSCEEALKSLQQRMDTAEPPGCEPDAVEAQRVELAAVEAALHAQAPKVDACRETGQQLLRMVGESEKPELQHHLDELNNTWETVTAAFHRRHDDLIEAMERAMSFHEMLGDVTEYLSNAETRFQTLEPISSNLLELQEQIEEVAAFKNDLDQQAVVLQQLNQQCDHLAEGRSSEQAAAIKRPMQDLNRRWDQLSSGVRQRRDKLDEAYVKAGHFQQALDQVLDWIDKTDKTLDEIRPMPGDLKQIEIEIAKHRVLQNDVHSRQTSLDTLNDAGRKLLASHIDADPKVTQQKLDTLNSSWTALLEKLTAKGLELEACKGEASKFGDQVQNWLHWLADVDDFLSSTKAVGGLPETTREQLDTFMILYEDIKTNQPKIEETLKLGDEYSSKSPENATSALAQQVKTLKQRWDTALTKATDRKTKLEIAYTDALEFDELMKQFTEWLMNAEQYLNGLLPVSRLMEGIESQMNEHTQFREEVNAERAVALELNEKGTKLKYYCQKQDVILIKNLLVSTQHRWDKVVSRTADRTKQLDHAYADVREFHVLWKELCDWCADSLRQLEEARTPGRKNKAELIRENLNQHKEFQKELGNRQPNYDAATKLGKQLKDHAPKSEQPTVQEMLTTLREKWNALCNRSIDRQRELEEDLLFAGQFKEAVEGLLKWLAEAEPTLSADVGVHGDIDTVTGLVDQHKNFMAQLKAREATIETVRKAGEELMRTGENPDVEGQLVELNAKWDRVKSLAADKESRLADAKALAEKFYHGAHATLEWLSDMETKVKYAGAIPDDEEQLTKQLQQLEKLQEELVAQKAQLADVLALGNDILTKCHPDAVQPMKQWLVILQARWDEVASWAQEREGRLKDQLNALKEQDALLDSLLTWLMEKDAYLQDLESEAIPDDLPLVEHLIEEHAQFEDTLRSRQPDFDEATKGRRRQDPMEQSQTGKDTKSKKPRRAIDRGRNPKVQQVSEKFSHVWLMSMDRKRKLDEMLNHLREVRKMRDFNFDDWRRRYTAWMNNKKSRVMDFFRRQDKDGDGKVTREEFIEGILQSKFPTTRMEMNAVADIFDKDGDGYIDYREFINALRPDRETTQPKTDSQRIKSEVQRQAQLCTCRKKYEIQELGEGKYRFGEQLRLVRILRSTVMVRVGGGWMALDEFLVKNDPCRAKGRTNIELREKFILAEGVSQTMLPFKSKNPRGGFAGSHASSSSGSSMASPHVAHTHDHHHHHHPQPLRPYRHTPGPIMKVSEKTERSMPMSKHPPRSPHLNGNGAGGGGSSVDSEVSGILSTSRRSSADLLSPDGPITASTPRSHGRVNGAGTSRPGSRGGTNIPAPSTTAQTSSRPPSRAGSDISDISLRSHDSLSATTPTRIPSARKRTQK